MRYYSKRIFLITSYTFASHDFKSSNFKLRIASHQVLTIWDIYQSIGKLHKDPEITSHFLLHVMSVVIKHILRRILGGVIPQASVSYWYAFIIATPLHCNDACSSFCYIHCDVEPHRSPVLWSLFLPFPTPIHTPHTRLRHVVILDDSFSIYWCRLIRFHISVISYL